MTTELLEAIKLIYTTNNYSARVNIINHLIPLSSEYDDLVYENDGNEDKADEVAFADFLTRLASIRNSINEFLKSNLYLD